ncbi:MAG TPA: LysM peptidoglycan-binding domain-containing protein, partial [Chloroflexia bacterium]|nr:LysM peptidoglycan-binding domain-containing protein [Chloroflexia bacterium]
MYRGWLLLGILLVLCAWLLVGVAYADSRYTVREGDTLSGIAAQHGVSIDSIRVANKLDVGATIYAGQELIIPSASDTPVPAVPAAPAATSQSSTGTYVVQEGDGLISVARKL